MAGKNDSTEKLAERLAQAFIARMEEVKLEWRKPWMTRAACPLNIGGRNFSMGNAFLLMMHSQVSGYAMPVYMTFHQAGEMGISVRKGERSVPVPHYGVTYSDREGGKPITPAEYMDLGEEEQEKYVRRAHLRFYPEFNVDQTTLKEKKPDVYDALMQKFSVPELRDEAGMARAPQLDFMLENQTWICPVRQELQDRAFYSPSFDTITLPMKGQFDTGEDFYGTLLHEMAHSTGPRLDRKIENPFGSEEYGREELVAEMTSAVTAASFGISSGIQENNVAYLQGWIDAIRSEPRMLLSVMADVSRAASFIQNRVANNEVSEKVIREAKESINSALREERKAGIPTVEDISSLGISIKGVGTGSGDVGNIGRFPEKEAEGRETADIRIFRLGSNDGARNMQYGIAEFRDGKRGPVYRVSRGEASAFFEAVRGKGREYRDEQARVLLNSVSYRPLKAEDGREMRTGRRR